MNHVWIGNGYFVEIEPRNVTLKQKYIGKRKDGTKKEAVKIISHCGSLEQALDMYLRINQIPTESKYFIDLMSYADFIEQSNKDAVRALKSVVDGKESDDDVCEWKWGPYYANVQCKGDKIIFGTVRLFTFCPYCGKKIKVVDNHEVN